MLWIAPVLLSIAALAPPPALAAGRVAASAADAAQHGDLARLETLLKQGTDPNTPQVDGTTALHWAAYRDDLAAASRLISAGADARLANRYRVTPLALAGLNGNAGMIELLLQSGADPSTVLPGGETALMTAARTGRLEAVRALLRAGADLHAQDEIGGQTALMWAAAEGHAEVVRELIRAGARTDDRVAAGFTPLLFAAREGRGEVTRELLQARAPVDDFIRPPDGPGEARSYSGAPPYGATALLIATENAHFDLATVLLRAGADPNANIPGYTPLHAIARVRKPGLGDNDPPPQGSGTMTSLGFVEALVEHGADLDAQMTKHVNLGNTRLKKLGATPFFLAAQSADAELMRKLVELGADPLIPNAENSSPLLAAAGLGTRSPGEDAGTEEEVLEAVAAALEFGADINTADDNGETVMHAAAYKNLPRVVEYLAEQGADISAWNRKNRFGWTPLAIATGYRFGNFKPSAVTVAALRRTMLANGVTPPERVRAETEQTY